LHNISGPSQLKSWRRPFFLLLIWIDKFHFFFNQWNETLWGGHFSFVHHGFLSKVSYHVTFRSSYDPQTKIFFGIFISNIIIQQINLQWNVFFLLYFIKIFQYPNLDHGLTILIFQKIYQKNFFLNKVRSCLAKPW